jgi:xanthine dehydrogenase small subunit
MEWLPEYFSSIPERLTMIASQKAGSSPGKQLIGGGTDLMVQQYDTIRQDDAVSTEGWLPNQIEVKNGKMMVGGGVSIQSFFDSQLIRSALPRLQEVYPLIASRQIRNMGTLAGNMVNASPIGDLTIMLLALGADLMVENGSNDIRQIALRDFFLDYKLVDLKDGEVIKFIVFNTLEEGGLFDFEKVSKRKHLDIASVNSSISIVLEKGVIAHLGYAVGGVAPVPKYMSDTVAFLCGKKLDTATLKAAIEVMQAELSPISDIRGSEAYKRLLARQLFLQHFLSMFPGEISINEII